jgi:hypothetical protein
MRIAPAPRPPPPRPAHHPPSQDLRPWWAQTTNVPVPKQPSPLDVLDLGGPGMAAVSGGLGKLMKGGGVKKLMAGHGNEVDLSVRALSKDSFVGFFAVNGFTHDVAIVFDVSGNTRGMTAVFKVRVCRWEPFPWVRGWRR